MKKFIIGFLLSGLFFSHGYSQLLKKGATFSNPYIDLTKKVIAKPYGNTKRNPLAYRSALHSFYSPMDEQKLRRTALGINVIEFDQLGLPVAFESKHTSVYREKPKVDFYSNYLKEALIIGSEFITFELINREEDERSTTHFKFQQKFKNISILNAEYYVHAYSNGELFSNGKAKLIPSSVNIEPSILPDQVEEICINYFKSKEIPYHNMSTLKALKTGIKSSQLFISVPDNGIDVSLIYLVKVTPNYKENWELKIDAMTGSVIEAHSLICHFANCKTHAASEMSPTGDETASALDLFNTNQTIHVWKEGSVYYLMDASRVMFSSSRSKFPDNPVGVIVTLDARNRSAESTSFDVDYISSTNNSWPSKTSISAHVNATRAYEYYRMSHSRNSIDGAGGNILSIINVREGGKDMDNAFWNGEAMFYGNGNQDFTALAKGVDVAGHEMTHGVIAASANLNYENESGAINESYADIYGAMIDREDWKIGEDVVIKSVFPSGALRDLSDPHNGGNKLGDNGYQPRHVNEQYTGTLDNGGVHINSGIPNYAFYLFVTELAKFRTLEEAKKVAEKVYYYALTRCLTRSSNFKDLRICIERACTDLFSSQPDVLNGAKSAFDKVGILGSGGGSNPGNRVLSTNPGKEFIVCTDVNKAGLYLYDFVNNPEQISTTKIYSKPSVTDNGAEIYYVGDDKKLYGMFFDQTSKSYKEFVLDPDPIYRSVSVSKDGYLLSVVFDVSENFIHVYNFDSQKWGDFKLYNPSYSNTVTGSVQYADVMDFDHSGEYVMYDAFNTIKKANGQNYEYWDIGFIRVFDNASNKFGDGKVQKLVASLPDNVAIGNPVFSKNSLDVIAFDYIEEDIFGSTLQLIGANIEVGDFQSILSDRPVLSFANYSAKDNRIIFDGENGSGGGSLNVIQLAANKIQSNGQELIALNGGKWGVWFANGTRKLTINVQDHRANENFIVRPNPFEKECLMEYNCREDDNLSLEIYDPMGILIHSQFNKVTTGLNAIRINMSEYNDGIYFLNVRNAKGSTSVKLIKN